MIIDPEPTILDAFDRNGIYMGSAQLVGSTWTFRIKAATGEVVSGEAWTRGQVEIFLRGYGAVTIQESDGKKG